MKSIVTAGFSACLLACAQTASPVGSATLTAGTASASPSASASAAPHPSASASPSAAPSASASASATIPNVVRASPWKTVTQNAFCVTAGPVTPRDATHFAVDIPMFRGVSAQPSDSRAQLAFTYVGPTIQTSVLGSGTTRHQLGLKLRAKDPCNLLYVIWRLDPPGEIAVQTKSNPGQTTSKECTNHGYATVTGKAVGTLPAVAVGSSHVLRAEITGTTLNVFADGAAVWTGTVPAGALAIDGPVGVRTDNARIEAELLAASPRAATACAVADGGD